MEGVEVPPTYTCRGCLFVKKGEPAGRHRGKPMCGSCLVLLARHRETPDQVKRNTARQAAARYRKGEQLFIPDPPRDLG